MTDTKHDNLTKIGESAYGAILDLLADYDSPYRHHDHAKIRELLDLEPDDEITTDDYAQLADEDPERIKDDAEQAIHDDPLDIEYRAGWYSAGQDMPEKPEEFRVLVTTGGPAVRIIGELDARGSIDRARLQVQDWGTTWTDFFSTDQSVLIRYCEMIGVGSF